MMRWLRTISIILFSLVITYIALPFLISPVYNFEPFKPFSGSTFYNPYQEAQKFQWFKGNFHYHSNAWGYLTDGRSTANTVENIQNKFKALDYNVVGISDYMSINPASAVRLYEHGMGAYKAHRLVMGNSNVLWLDFIPLHNMHHKQFMINLLKTDSNMIALAHPSWNNAYTPTDVKVLGNYDCFEIQNTNKESVALWDSALSAGKPVFLMSDDDGHDMNDPGVTARIFTYLLAKDSSEASIISAFKEGRTIGVILPWYWNPDTAIRHELHRSIFIPHIINFSGDSLNIQLADTVKEIKLIGQNGKILTQVSNTKGIIFMPQLNETYVRTEITLRNEIVLYLNPLIRSTGNLPKINCPVISVWKTILVQILLWPLYFMSIILFYRVMKGRRKGCQK